MRSIKKQGGLNKIIFFMIIIIFGGSIAILVYSLTIGSTSLVKNFSETESEDSPLKNNISNGIFNIQEITFYDRSTAQKYANISNRSFTNETLCDREKEYLILKLLLNNKNMPNNCNIIVDRQAVANLNENDLFKIEGKSKETVIPINLGNHTPARKHKIQVCCDNFCQDEEIQKQCQN
ncbi:MAG: hypothetical protein ACOCZ6_02205 [Nanoarchaeota archaeon]